MRYLDTIVTADHGELKLLVRPVRGFEILKTAYATIRGFAVMRALRKGQAALLDPTGNAHGEARLAEHPFGLSARAPGEVVCLIDEQLTAAARRAPSSGRQTPGNGPTAGSQQDQSRGLRGRRGGSADHERRLASACRRRTDRCARRSICA